MKNFEMIVENVFYLTDGRMVFSGQFTNNNLNNGFARKKLIHIPY